MRTTSIPFVTVSCAAFVLLVFGAGPAAEPLQPQASGAPLDTQVAQAAARVADLVGSLVTPKATESRSQRVRAIEAPEPIQPVVGMGHIEPKSEPLILPLQLVLQADATPEDFEERYGMERDEDLVRQQVRLLRLVQGQFATEALPPFQQRVVADLMQDADALSHELQWIQSMLWTRMVAKDLGFKLLTPKSAAILRDELKLATREDLQVTEWQLRRQHVLEEGRACDLLIHQGRYVDEPGQLFL